MSESHEADRPGRLGVGDLPAAFALAAAHAVFLQWKVFLDPYTFHNNWRQAPHWIRASRNAFQPDDILVRYAEFNTAPFENALYRLLGTLGQDILWGKINGVVFYALAAAVVYATGRAFCGRFGGWVATGLFMFLPPNFKTFSGGFSSGMSMPLICLGLLFVHRRRWWAFVPLIAAQVYVYPVVAIHTGAALIVDTLAHDMGRLRDPQLWRKKLLPLGVAAAIMALAVGAKYSSDHGFGHLVDRVEIGDRAEFGRSGRGLLLPVPSLTHELARKWTGPFHLLLYGFAFLYLGRRMFELPRGLGSLLVASVALYWLSDLLLFRLYYPSRYLLRSLPLIVAFAGACWMVGIRERASTPIAPLHRRLRWIGRTPQWCAVAALLVVVGLHSFRGDLRPPGARLDSFAMRAELHEAIRDLPGRPMLACSPVKASEIPILTGKSVLATKELAHPWWSGIWELSVERIHDFFRAYHSDDPDELRRLTVKHRIDYWVIDLMDFDGGRWREGRVLFEPFDSWIEETLRPEGVSLLATLPDSLKLWSDDRYFIVASTDLFEYLDRRGAVDER